MGLSGTVFKGELLDTLRTFWGLKLLRLNNEILDWGLAG